MAVYCSILLINQKKFDPTMQYKLWILQSTVRNIKLTDAVLQLTTLIHVDAPVFHAKPFTSISIRFTAF
jgi:hypothetical protein